MKTGRRREEETRRRERKTRREAQSRLGEDNVYYKRVSTRLKSISVRERLSRRRHSLRGGSDSVRGRPERGTDGLSECGEA